MSAYLTDDDIAERLHLDRKQVQALARQGRAEADAGIHRPGQLIGFKVGQKWRFTEAAFRAFTGETSAPPAVTLLGLNPATARSIRRRAS